MEIKEVEFVGSFPSTKQCPSDGRPEYAFIGRSNVGKSSLINMLIGKKNMAHTSGKPGKTQMLNYYLVNKEWYVVDLPGYGYAKVSQTKRKEWQKLIFHYLANKPEMQCAFVLLDAMIDPQPADMEFMNTLGERLVPFVIAYTKTDRINPQEVEPNIEKIQAAILEHWEALPQQFITSAERGHGRQEMLTFIEDINKKYLTQL